MTVLRLACPHIEKSDGPVERDLTIKVKRTRRIAFEGQIVDDKRDRIALLPRKLHREAGDAHGIRAAALHEMLKEIEVVKGCIQPLGQCVDTQRGPIDRIALRQK